MQDRLDISDMPLEFRKYYKLWVKHINICNDVFHKQLKLTNMRKCWLTYHNPYDAVLPGDFYMLKEKHEVEMAVLYGKQIELHKKIEYYKKKLNNIYKINADNSIRRKITKSKKRQLERETCSVCLENHCIKDMVTTSCGHHFGKSCFEEIIKNSSYKQTCVSCPLCRNSKVQYYRYCVK
jgi:hypothetical protein